MNQYDISSVIPDDIKSRSEKVSDDYWKLPHDIVVTSDDGILLVAFESTDRPIFFYDEPANEWFVYIIFRCSHSVDVQPEDVVSELIAKWVGEFDG